MIELNKIFVLQNIGLYILLLKVEATRFIWLEVQDHSNALSWTSDPLLYLVKQVSKQERNKRHSQDKPIVTINQ